MPSETFTDPMQAGGLIRALVLRAQLARGMGDLAIAQRWASLALEPLDNPDPFLRPTKDDMRQLARSSN